MSNAAESITRLIGGLHHPNEVRNLLDEVDNGDEERSRIAKETLRNLPGVSTELLATLQVAIRLDEFSTALISLQRQHNEIHGIGGRGCPPLKIETERLQKMFFRGVCICLLVPILLWAFISATQFLWRQQEPQTVERAVQDVWNRDSGNR